VSGTPGNNRSIVGHAPVLESMWSILAQPADLRHHDRLERNRRPGPSAGA